MPLSNTSDITFLLADDDADDKTLFCEALAEIDPGIICHTAADGKEALAILSETRARKPDIIFLDINMPIMDGWQCLGKLKEDRHHKNIPVIMYSTSSYQRDIDLALQNGAICFFTKPSDYRELRSILRLIATHPVGSLSDVMKEFKNLKFTR
ncbi:MAG TPA: response regulator [Cyclobacteriaceae bacterium]|nr:response regulator [Cyclobacteriaceae bacterium]